MHGIAGKVAVGMGVECTSAESLIDRSRAVTAFSGMVEAFWRTASGGSSGSGVGKARMSCMVSDLNAGHCEHCERTDIHEVCICI
jgi:hypothetical protein